MKNQFLKIVICFLFSLLSFAMYANSDLTPIMVSAYLIYEDGSLSDFDVLNDKTKALWNTVIGAGDVEKPSKKIKVVITGNEPIRYIRIKNGKKPVVAKKNVSITNKIEFVILDTGCEPVEVEVAGRKSNYKGVIDFKCGE